MAASPFGFLPAQGWWSLFAVLVLGIVIIILGHRWLAAGKLPRDIVRDVGIAFVVAFVVSGIYEFSTRSVHEHKTVLASINLAMSERVGDSVWKDIAAQTVYRNAIRYNVQIKFRLRHTAELTNGKIVPLPSDKAVLWMSYSYDLEGLAAGESALSIQHELDYFMRNDKLDLPRFERVLIIDPDTERPRIYEGDSLQKIYNKGTLKLEGAHSVVLPPRGSGKRITVLTERYELVNVPGYYYLVMRELTVRDEHSPAPTVKVTIEERPDDVDVDVATYYAPHRFTAADQAKTVWTLDGTMLPGQGLTIVLTPRSARY